MRKSLIELLKSDIAYHDAALMTTPHLSNIRNKEAELLALLEAPDREPGPEVPVTVLDKDALRLFLGGAFSDRTPTERLVADASLIRRDLRIRAGEERGEAAFPDDPTDTLHVALECYGEEIRKRLRA